MGQHHIVLQWVFGVCLAVVAAALSAEPPRVLMVGNSFTFGYGSAVRYYRHERVTDLNQEGIGGVPALVDQFLAESATPMSVFLETHPGVGLEWHWREKKGLLTAAPYDYVFLQTYSTLDARAPGDPTLLVDYTQRWGSAFKAVSPRVKLFLVSTWSRPDLTFPADQHWSGHPISDMAIDIRRGVDRAAKASPEVAGVVPVGEAFNLAMELNLAVANPYQPLPPGLMDLWTYDHYHASTFGYYLEALMIYATITHRPATDLGPHECVAHELGLSPQQASDLQRVATQTMRSASLPLAQEQPLTQAIGTRCTP